MFIRRHYPSATTLTAEYNSTRCKSQRAPLRQHGSRCPFSWYSFCILIHPRRRQVVYIVSGHLCDELNDTAGLLDLLLGLSRDIAGADDDGDFGKTTLAEDL